VEAIVAALLTLAGTLLLIPLSAAWIDVKRHDHQIAERDESLGEWIIIRHRGLLQRFSEMVQEANAQGVLEGGTVPAGQTAVRTTLLYEYREELRQARGFVLSVGAEEWWPHALVRRIGRRPFPHLVTPDRALRLIDYWSEGTARNALTWSLDDVLADLPVRATSRALATDA
jgi:hypothetical protein